MAISQVGLMARSPEGHAARGMPIKGHETSWVTIQTHTFTNWLNEQLRPTGLGVTDLAPDLADGTKLCALVETLQRRKLAGVVRKPTNRHHQLENVSIALSAVAEDGVRLVNIGNVDIVNGNLKLVLGLIWSLIVRYQIGRSNFPPKKFMLAWLRAVLPECRVNNFTTDWNSGVYLSALVEYCQPGTFPHWQSLSPLNSVDNCEKAMEIARSRLGVPMILEPEYLASPHLDELSGMTYLSYFMKENSPGFRATLRWVNSRLPPHSTVSNFTSDWQDGSALCSLVSSLGVSARCRPGSDPLTWEHNLNNGMEGGRKLGVEPMLRGKDLVGSEVDHLGVMAYVAAFQWITPRPPAHTLLAVNLSSHSTRVFQQTTVKIDILEDDLDRRSVTCEVVGPEGERVFSRLVNLDSHDSKLVFTPTRIGMHEVRLMYDGERAKGSPAHIRAMPELSTVKYTGGGMQPCAVGSILEVLVHSVGPGEASITDMEVRAVSPTGRWLDCPVHMKDGGYSATFQPDEPGHWTIQVKHSGSQVHDQPYTCLVYDPNGIKLLGIEESEKIHKLRLDATGTCGLGEIQFDVVRDRTSVPHTVQRPSDTLYELTLHTHKPGKYRLYIYFNGTHIKGSPFPFRVGWREHHHRDSTNHYWYDESKSRRSSGRIDETSKSREERRSTSTGGQHHSSERSSEWVSPRGTVSVEHSSEYVSSSHASPLRSTKRVSERTGGSEWVSSSPSHSGVRSERSTNSEWINSTTTPLRSGGGRVEERSTSNEWVNTTASPLRSRTEERSNSNEWVNTTASPLRSRTEERSNSSEWVSSTPPARSTSLDNTDSFETLKKTTTTLNTTRETYYRRSVVSPVQSTPALLHSSGHMNGGYRSILDGGRSSPLDRPTSPLQLSSLGRTSPLSGHASPLGTRTSPLGAHSSLPGYISPRGGQASPLGGHSSPLGGHSSPLGGHSSLPGYTSPLSGHTSPLLTSSNTSRTVLGGPNHRTVSSTLETHSSSLVRRHATSPLPGDRTSPLGGGALSSHSQSPSHHTTLLKVRSPSPNVIYHSIHTTSSTSSKTPSKHKDNGIVVGGVGSASVWGEALKQVEVGRISLFNIDTDAPISQITITVTGPACVVPVKMWRGEETGGKVSASFTATDVGEHLIDVRIRDRRVPGSPFRSEGFDPRAIKVGSIPETGTVGQPVEFEIDGRNAGSGNLEIQVNEGEVTSFVRNLGNQRFLASFVPVQPSSHLVRITFNGLSVPGSPWTVGVMSGSGGVQALGEGVRLVPVGLPCWFQLSALGISSRDVEATVLGPSKHVSDAVVCSEGRGLFRLELMPREVGSHVVEVRVAGQPLPGGPLVAKAYDASLIRVTDVPSGVIGQPCQFKVDASEAGEGQLEISINEGEVPNHVTVVGGGRCLVSFTPEINKPHLIDIKFNGETVSGCPLVCNVADSSKVSLSLEGLELIPVGQAARFHMSVEAGGGSAELAVSVRGPESELPVSVTGSVAAGFTAEFTPRCVGPHTLSVLYNGQPVSGTPFTSKAYDSSTVYVGPLPHARVGTPLQFTVDASQAGEGNLEITISARGVNVPTQVQPQGSARFLVSFLPLEPTNHVVTIHFNQEPVPGSPFTAVVTGDDMVASGAALSSAQLGSDSHFSLTNIVGPLSDVSVTVEGPGGSLVPADVRPSGDSATVHFSPRLVGEHIISVNYRGVSVAGSPFTCKVYDVNAIRVRPATIGTVGQPVTFIVETREAGPGNLEVTVNQGRVGTSAHTQGPHTYAISFTPRSASTHTVHLKFNRHDVPGSPFSVEVSDGGKVMVPSEDKIAVGRPSSFLVDSGSLGPPQVQVMSASRQSVAVSLSQQGKHHLVSFTPRQVGDHSIEVKLNGNHAEGSPFLLKAYDASRVKVTDINSGRVNKPVYFSINASEAGAGNLEIIVAVNGRNVPNYVQSEGNAKFRVNFKPKEASQHTLSVRFNGEPIPGSPFVCDVFERGEVEVWGGGVKSGQAGVPVSLSVGVTGGSSESTEVRVTSPTGHRLPVKLTADSNSSSTITATFTPVEVGRHTVVVEVDGESVKGGPFHCNVYNVNNIKVSTPPPAKVGKPVVLSVDATEAGEGTLELVISTQNTTVKAEVNAVSRGLYDVTFVPHLPQPHHVNITFNDRDVPGSPVRCEVSGEGGEVNGTVVSSAATTTATARGEGLSSAVVGNPAYFQINPHSSHTLHTNIQAFITGPDGVREACRVEKTDCGLFRGEYVASGVGPHSLIIMQDSRPITRQPFTVHVFDPSAVRLYDLSAAIVGAPATFKVDTRGAGSGALSVAVKGGGQEVKHTLRELDTPGLYQVIYHPRIATTHRIHLLYNNLYPPGSPVEVEVDDEVMVSGGLSSKLGCRAKGSGLYEACVGRSSTFVIVTAGSKSEAFDVIVTGPGSTAVPVRCYQQKDGDLMAEFTPNMIGGYKVEVLCDSAQIHGSPYYCQVFDPSAVRVENLLGSTVPVHDDISFKLKRRDAGCSEVGVLCRGPGGRETLVPIQNLSVDTDLVEFCPSLPGRYAFHVTYGRLPIPESPVVFEAEEGGWGRAWGGGLERARVGREARFQISGGGARPTVLISRRHGSGDTPQDTNVPSQVKALDERKEMYEVVWTPRYPGAHDVAVLQSSTSQHLPGSPYRVDVVAPDKVRPLHTLPPRIVTTVGSQYTLLVDTSLAGPGELRCEVSSGGKTGVCSVEMVEVDRWEVVVSPGSPGPHLLCLEYGGFPLEWSPLTVMAEQPTGTVRLVLTGRGLASATTHHSAHFTIDGSQAGPGIPEVSLVGMKAEIKVDLEKVSDCVYRANYTPTLPGAYLLNVTWSGRQVKGCPLKVTVAAASDASKVICSGEGLGVGTVGKHIRSFIDTRAAGPGELSAHCVGPGKVAYCELYDHGDGTFTLNVKPQEPGKHTLTVKYAGADVPGSPFVLRVAGPADASRVRVYGPGIQHGVLATFQSRFICDTRGAGAGQLSVRVRGPKGAFRVEMQRSSQRDRQIVCKYDPTEPGDYRVEVKWAGDLVPGSPFPVMIFDTQEELNKYLQGNGSPTNDIYGSVAYSTGYAHITA